MCGEGARVLIVAGEASGDLYGGLLMRALSAGGRAVEFSGAGGPAMEAAGLRRVGDASSMGVTGLTEVLGNLPALWKAYRAARRAIDDPARRPDLAILIDYPDFNLRLAAHARRARVPVLYFISPQLWAWRPRRILKIAQRVDRMLVILPFEEAMYREAGVPVEFVGHPLLDLVRAGRTRRQTAAVLGLDAARPIVALLPGSRVNELAAHLPPMVGAAGLLAEEFGDLQFVLPVAPTLSRPAVEAAVRRAGGRAASSIVLVGQDRYDAVAAADAAAVASGTATLETALLGVPMVIVYRMSRLTFALARRLARVPHIGMANLIAGARVVPELVQGDCTPRTIAAELRRILTEPATAQRMRQALAGVRERLGPPGAIARAAAAAWGMISAARGARVA